MAEEILEEAGELGDAFDAVNSDAELDSMNQDFASSFPNMSANGFEGVSFEEGEAVITNSDGSSVKLSDINDNIVNGNFEGLLSDLKVDIGDPDVQKTIAELNADYAESPAGQLEADEVQVAARANDLPADMDNAVDDATLQSTLKDGEFTGSAAGADIDTATKEIQGIQQDAIQRGATGPDDPEFKANVQDWFDKYGKGFGRLLIRGIEIFALFWLAKSLYDLLKQIAAAMSGCWSTQGTVNTSAIKNYIRYRVQAMLIRKGKLPHSRLFGSSQSGTCKIEPLTCNPADLVAPTVGKGYVACVPCTDVTNTAGCDWIPLQLGTSCTCYVAKGNLYPGQYDPGATTGTNPCTGTGQAPCVPPNPSTRERYMIKSMITPITTVPPNTSYACPGANGCIATAEACANTPTADCSNWCNNQYVVTLPGQEISCKQCSITCAFANVMDNFVPAVSSIFGTIEKILLWVAVGIVILIVLFVVFKEILHYAMKDGSIQQKRQSGTSTSDASTAASTSSSDSDELQSPARQASVGQTPIRQASVQQTPKRGIVDQIKYNTAQKLQQTLVNNQDQIAQVADSIMQKAAQSRTLQDVKTSS